MRVLVMGLPDSGKTTLAKPLAARLNYKYLNADEVRTAHNDWDFSIEARLRSAARMRDLSQDGNYICDFVCPLNETRLIFAADFTIWMNTIESGRFEDTNKMFERPNTCDVLIESFDYSIDAVIERILNKTSLKG
jgi:adenylylsulfate kinase